MFCLLTKSRLIMSRFSGRYQSGLFLSKYSAKQASAAATNFIECKTLLGNISYKNRKKEAHPKRYASSKLFYKRTALVLFLAFYKLSSADFSIFIYSGVVPQHPPTIFTPSPAYGIICSANCSGLTV